MQNLRTRQVQVHERAELRPVQTTPLAPASQRLPPATDHSRTVSFQRRYVPRYGVGGEEAPHHTTQPQALPTQQRMTLTTERRTHPTRFTKCCTRRLTSGLHVPDRIVVAVVAELGVYVVSRRLSEPELFSPPRQLYGTAPD
jgi:hypothetical protein